MAIQLTMDQEKRACQSIQRFFAEQLEESIGELRCRLVLDFFLKELGPTVYNLAVHDLQQNILDRVADMEDSCSKLEFTYWKK